MRHAGGSDPVELTGRVLLGRRLLRSLRMDEDEDENEEENERQRIRRKTPRE